MAKPAVRFRVDFGRHEAVGPGKIALLEQIERGGSLSEAARILGMSYRRAWQLLESVNGSFARPAVVTARGGRGGGGATLTPFGRRLIRLYRGFDAEVQTLAGRRFGPIMHAVERSRGSVARQRGGAAPVLRLKDR
jgi:molybdate transport system regulatory protein